MQLAITIIMMGVRSFTRRGLRRRVKPHDIPENKEVAWFSSFITGTPGVECLTGAYLPSTFLSGVAFVPLTFDFGVRAWSGYPPASLPIPSWQYITEGCIYFTTTSDGAHSPYQSSLRKVLSTRNKNEKLATTRSLSF